MSHVGLGWKPGGGGERNKMTEGTQENGEVGMGGYETAAPRSMLGVGMAFRSGLVCFVGNRGGTHGWGYHGKGEMDQAEGGRSR